MVVFPEFCLCCTLDNWEITKYEVYEYRREGVSGKKGWVEKVWGNNADVEDVGKCVFLDETILSPFMDREFDPELRETPDWEKVGSDGIPDGFPENDTYLTKFTEKDGAHECLSVIIWFQDIFGRWGSLLESRILNLTPDLTVRQILEKIIKRTRPRFEKRRVDTTLTYKMSFALEAGVMVHHNRAWFLRCCLLLDGDTRRPPGSRVGCN
ncbi:hypothetical protein TWF281_006965 [Arthrobotrys megalospora]